MKERIAVTIDKESLELLESLVESKKYRNRSHAVESAIQFLVKKEENEKRGKRPIS